MTYIMKFIHFFAHLFKWNTGKLMVGFRCDGCKKLQDIHESRFSKDF
jgi:hypothetical protein